MNESLYCATVLGANVFIVKFGATSESNKIGELIAPAPPTAETPGSWIKLGRIKSANPNFEYKTLDAEGCDDDGRYSIEELRMPTKRKFQLTTNTITKEAIQLTYGLPDDIVDNTEQIPFSSTDDEIKCWVYHRLRDSYHQGTELANLMFAARLRLTKPITFSSDVTSVEWEMSIIPSPLNEFTPTAISKPSI